MKKLANAAVLLALVAGCGADELNASTTATTQELPVAPTGTVSGQVLDTLQAPLPGATVKLVVGLASQTTTSDDDGQFAFGEVPAGSSALVIISKSGYSTVRTTAFVPSSAGQFPLADGNARVGPVTLAALTGTLTFRVLNPQGDPAIGATARVDASPAGANAEGSLHASVTVDGVVDAQGLLTFAGLPAPVELMNFHGRYTLWINPQDVDGDGIPDIKGEALELEARALINAADPRTIILQSATPSGPLSVETGNVGSLFGELSSTRNLVKPGDPIRLVFNAPLEAASALVRLTNEDASEELAVTTSLVAGQTLVITPAQSVAVGAEYNIHVRVVATSGAVYARTGWFFGGQPSAPPELKVAVSRYQETTTDLPGQLNPGEEIFIEFNQVLRRDVAGGAQVEVFFNHDIDGDFQKGGDTVGEVGNSTGRGFPLTELEPTSPFAATPPDSPAVFPIEKSGYTTRYKFIYTGTIALDPGLVELVVDFDALRERSTDLYQTAWTVPAKGRFTTGLLGIPPVTP